MQETLLQTLARLAGDDRALGHPGEVQEEVLLGILKKNQNTLFARKYALDEIDSATAYVRRMPLMKYDDMKPYIEQMKAGATHILLAEDFPRWAQTSGTTSSEPKLYPFPWEVIEDAAHLVCKLMLHAIEEEPERENMLLGKMLFLVADVVTTSIAGKPVGYFSGIVAHDIQKIPGLETMFTPPADVLAMQGWEARWLEMARCASRENVTMAVSTPPILLSYFKKITDEYRPVLDVPENIKELWPNMTLIIGAGVKMSLYEKKFKEILGDQACCREFYAATEGVFAYQKDAREGMEPIIDRIFYEFIPLHEWQAARADGEDYRTYEFTRLLYDQVKLNEDYILVITSPIGLYNYVIGDIVRFIARNRIIWVGRAEFESNIAGEKMNEMHMSMLKKSVESTMGVEIANQVASVQEDPLRYVFAFEFEGNVDLTELIETVDKSTRELNPIYDWLREKNVLKYPEIVKLPRGAFDRYFRWKQEQTGTLGQIKPPVFASRDLIEKLKE
jgi:hypothetical protein